CGRSVHIIAASPPGPSGTLSRAIRASQPDAWRNCPGYSGPTRACFGRRPGHPFTDPGVEPFLRFRIRSASAAMPATMSAAGRTPSMRPITSPTSMAAASKSSAATAASKVLTDRAATTAMPLHCHASRRRTGCSASARCIRVANPAAAQRHSPRAVGVVTAGSDSPVVCARRRQRLGGGPKPGAHQHAIGAENERRRKQSSSSLSVIDTTKSAESSPHRAARLAATS
ncbi:MAG: hypothetical protein QOE48_3260, partial [Mycobacterium sp.]|nr:hypothetical protein [Mycobacterium sp.]